MNRGSSKKKPPLIVVLGPTSSGKSDLAVVIAKEFNGEVVSADSRQVYRGMDIGTGKVTKKEMAGIPHHLLDVADPKRRYTVAQFKKDAEKAIALIHKKGKIPIFCGGTGYYIDTVVNNIALPKVKPNHILRKKLEKVRASELFEELLKLDPARAAGIDRHNPRRLIRAIEIAQALGKVPQATREERYDTLIIGIRTPDTGLRDLIEIRLKKRIRAGMVAEAKRLHDEGVSRKRMEELGLEYRYLARYLQEKLTKEEFIAKLTAAIWQFAKRQKTWFRKNKCITWLNRDDLAETRSLVQNFLKE